MSFYFFHLHEGQSEKQNDFIILFLVLLESYFGMKSLRFQVQRNFIKEAKLLAIVFCYSDWLSTNIS